VADRHNHCLRLLVNCVVAVVENKKTSKRVEQTEWFVLTVAGAPGQLGHRDDDLSEQNVDRTSGLCLASKSRLNDPTSLCLCGDGSVLITEGGGACIRKLHVDGSLTSLAGQSGKPGRRNGAYDQAQFNSPSSVVELCSYETTVKFEVPALHGGRTGVVALEFDNRVLAKRVHVQLPPDAKTGAFPPTGAMMEVMISGADYVAAPELQPPAFVDRVDAEVKVERQDIYTTYTQEMILVADSRNECIRVLHPGSDYVATVMGTYQRGLADGPGDEAQFGGPCALSVCPNGSIVSVDMHTNRIRKLAPPNVVEKIKQETAILRRPVIDASKKILSAAKISVENVCNVIQLTNDASDSLHRHVQLLKSVAFRRECKKIVITPSAISGLVNASPSVSSLVEIFHEIPKSLAGDAAASATIRDSLISYLCRYRWPSHPVDAKREVVALVNFSKIHNSYLSALAVETVFANDSFHVDVDDNTVRLIGFVVDLPYHELASFAKAVQRWIKSVVGLTKVIDQKTLEDGLVFWSDLTSQVTSELHPSLEWLAQQWGDTVVFAVDASDSIVLLRVMLVRFAHSTVMQSLLARMLNAQVSNCSSTLAFAAITRKYVAVHLKWPKTVRAVIDYLILSVIVGASGAREDAKTDVQVFSGDEQLETCVQFVMWYESIVAATISLSMADGAEDNSDSDVWIQLASIASRTSRAFEEAVGSISSEVATVRIVTQCVKYQKQVARACDALSLEFPAATLEQLSAEVEESREELQRVAEVATQFFYDEPFCEDLTAALLTWQALTIHQIRGFLSTGLDCPEEQLFPPLPDALMDSLDWLHQLLKSEMFAKIWEDQGSLSAELSRLIPASVMWQQLFNSIDTGSIKTNEIYAIGSFLPNERELEALASARGFELNGDADSAVWSVVGSDDAWVERVSASIHMWLKIDTMKVALPTLDNILKTIGYNFIDLEGMASVHTMRSCVQRLSQSLERNWLDVPLYEVNRFVDDIKGIDERLMRVDTVLLHCLVESMDLLDFLRHAFANDNDFTAAVEMGMGKSEMECPPQLWIEGTGEQPGRPDEQRMSILSSVRSYLHDFIYRDQDRFDDVHKFVDIVANLPHHTDMVKRLQMCNRLGMPLMELLGDDADEAAPTRILQLQEPERQACWVIEPNAGRDVGQNSASVLTLQYVVPRKKKTTKHSQTVAELMEFQSTVILAKSSQRTEETQLIIDNFMLQFSHMRRLAANVVELQNAGHFEYNAFRCVFALPDSVELIRQKVDQTREALDNWRSSVLLARKDNYHLNYYCMARLWACVRHLQMEQTAETKPVCLAEFRSIIQAVNCEYSEANINACWQRASAGWKEGPTESDDAISLLSRLGIILSSTCGTIKRRSRPFVIKNLEDYPVGADISSAVSIVCPDDASRTVDFVLSIYARVGLYPEFEDCVYCDPHTTFEDLNNLILRWQGARTNGHEGQTFCIACAEALSYDTQRRTVQAIRDSMADTDSSTPLFVVCSSTSHVAAQFASLRIPYIPVPLAGVEIVGSEKYQQARPCVLVHSSEIPGAGKTFAAKKLAASCGQVFIHVPIHTSMSPDELIKHIADCYKEAQCTIDDGKQVCLHFDLTDTIDSTFEAAIFGVIFQGGAVSSTCSWYWDPAHVVIVVEIMSGQLWDRLRTPQVVQGKHFVCSSAAFCVDENRLRRGMGTDFDCPVYHGTTHSVLRSTASERIQYVCCALSMLETRAGDFPIDFIPSPECIAVQNEAEPEPELEPEPEVEGSNLVHSEKFWHSTTASTTCYQLLEAATMQQQQGRGSFTTFWSFVNVLYWHLIELHDPSNIINGLCKPDSHSQVSSHDAATKQKIKCEIVRFLVKTAMEFSCRQVLIPKGERIVGVKAQGFQNERYNVTFSRRPFDNDAKPVFKYGQFFLYFRARESCWVIDDVVDAAGSVYSRSSGPDLNDEWVSAQGWVVDGRIKASLKFDVNGFGSEAVQIKCSHPHEDEDGTYLRLPPYDNIDGKGHYLKKKPRRHLFFNTVNGAWQISPLCNNNEGAFIMSLTADLIGQWMTTPKDQVEPRAQLEFIIRRPEEPEPEAEPEADEAATALENLDLSGYTELLRWNDSNHECLLFSNTTSAVNFLSLDPLKMARTMHPLLMEYLTQNGVWVAEDVDSLNARHHEIISGLTGVTRSKRDADGLLGGRYVITGDTLIKMMAIFVRVRCGIPVVLMGECGCGKTYLISYICEWLAIRLLILDINGGTTVADIESVFEDALAVLDSGQSDEIIVFLDEVNTCAHMGLIAEVICHRSMHGKSLPRQLKVLAALNPYRRRPSRDITPGLVYQLHGDAAPDPMAALVYRVHPIPACLVEFIFDFGALSAEIETRYIQKMAADSLPGYKNWEQDIVATLISDSQIFIRKCVGDESAVSLRDVRRCLDLTVWFTSKLTPKKNAKLPHLSGGMVLGLAFVYFYRLPSANDREEFWTRLRCGGISWRLDRYAETGWDRLGKVGVLPNILNQVQKNFVNHMELEPGIAMNEALQENVFVLTIGILNRIPVFLVGKPGTSKTLAMQVSSSSSSSSSS
jgi:hypothetical protein